tara:strand:+ start:652 stop:1587 length:936 start_codon:yes stop_codon:yes gene_type:complete
MAGYIGTKAVSVNTTSATITGDASIGGNVTLNDGSADVDFRVESNVSGDTHALFVDGATGHVGLGTSVLGAQFNVKGTGAVDAGIGSTNAGGAYLYLDGDSNGDFSGSDYSFIGHQTDGQLIINQDSPSGTQAILIKTAGTLAATISSSGINLADGNLTVASGHGIDFAATGDGAGTDTSELLDDYEEGTWTPVFTAITSPTYSHQLGFYTKVGRKVTFHMVLIWTAGTSIGRNIGGLPYDVGNGAEYYFMSSTYHGTGTTYPSGRTTFVAYPVKAQSYIQTACNGSNTAAVGATFGTAGDLYITGFYYIN